MPGAIVDRHRLEQLLDLAQAYRGWSRKQLAAALGRDPSNLVPESGVPKLDLVLRLAEALDWAVENVVDALHGTRPIEVARTDDLDSDDFEALDAEARRAHLEGRYADMIAIARQARAVADTPERRARAANREAGGLDGIGRYQAALHVLRGGLYENDVPLERRLLLSSNLSMTYYTLWHLHEAIGVACAILHRCDQCNTFGVPYRLAVAGAHYTRGNCYRRFIQLTPNATTELAGQALDDLLTARDEYLALADDFESESYRGIANTCHGAVVEVQAAAGQCDADEALADFTGRLDDLVSPENHPVGDMLESLGWCCIFAANVVLRHLTDPREQQRLMAIFTNKADEIAQRLDNWAIRERIVAMEVARRRRLGEWTGLEAPWTLDSEDLRVIAGTMGRFPSFQPTGWAILEKASIIRGS